MLCFVMKNNKPVIAPWAHSESALAACGDVRLNKRLGILLSALGQSPGVSIPQACGGNHAEIAAAYRFFDNPATSAQNILAAHVEQSLMRMAQQDTVLLVQDTTEMDMSQPQRHVHGAGPLADSSRQGAFLHLMHAFNLDGTPLGSVWHKLLVRAQRPSGRASARSRSQRQNIPVEEKESYRWIEGLAAAQAMALAQPHVHLICVADSEADIYEYLELVPQAAPAAPVPKADWIVRACQPRVLMDAVDPASSTLWEACRAAPVVGGKALQVRGRKGKFACDQRARRQPRADRDIEVEIRALSHLRLRPPYRKGKRLEVVQLNAVLVSEVSPPAGEVPVEWLLLTSLPVDSAAQAQQVVRAYGQRFMIEVFFRVLKSGCRIEERRFENVERHVSHLAVALIIAWRVLLLNQLGQHEPERSGQELWTVAEWRSAWAVTRRGLPMPEETPCVGEMIKMIGKLGGWIERGGKSYSPPGVQTLWQGLRRLYDLSTAWHLAHS
jgi:hypothetical protein